MPVSLDGSFSDNGATRDRDDDMPMLAPPPWKPSTRLHPNILITGTPGTGKTTTSDLLSTLTTYPHVNVGQVVKEKSCHEGVDTQFDSFILDEDKLVDELEPLLESGGHIVDFHSSEIFPERWFDLVVVLRTDNTVLYDRLAKRNYPQNKITENIECEIMQVCLDEAQDSYDESIIVSLSSDNIIDMERNVEWIQDWIINTWPQRLSTTTSIAMQ